MNVETIHFGSLFLEGLFAFYSPCVLPIIPLLIGYLNASEEIDDANLRRRITSKRIFFFVLGICSVFFLMALSTSALNRFLQSHQQLFQMLGGILLIVFGSMSLGWIQIPFLQREHRFQKTPSSSMTIAQAFLMGFFFSFAWTPCNGPLLASAIVVAATASTRALGFAYIAVFCFGFIFMFLLLGLFTEEVLSFLKRKQNYLSAFQKIAGALVIGVGIYMLLLVGRQWNQMSQNNTIDVQENESMTDLERYGFSLPDASGQEVDIRSYQGKTIVVNFFGTWCHYCNQLLPELQSIDDERNDIQVVLIAAPNLGSEGDTEMIENYMKEHGYSMEILYDVSYEMTQRYGISGYPTTFIYQPDGTLYGYVPGYVARGDLDTYLAEASQNTRK